MAGGPVRLSRTGGDRAAGARGAVETEANCTEFMKAATKLVLTIVVILCFVREAGAQDVDQPDVVTEFGRAYTVKIGDAKFALIDLLIAGTDKHYSTIVDLGPLGSFQVPFTATQGLVGVCVILALLVIVPLALAVRWKRKRSDRR
jgi:hypothetical protein